MKLLIVALNAKYVHTNLAVRYLYQVSGKICDVEKKRSFPENKKRRTK